MGHAVVELHGDDTRSRSNHLLRPVLDQDSRPRGGPPRTDAGTLVLHWLTTIAFLVSLLTGIRIAADAVHAPVSKLLSPILPQGEIWTWHFGAGILLLFSGLAYAVYMIRSGLVERNALKKTRVL